MSSFAHARRLRLHRRVRSPIRAIDLRARFPLAPKRMGGPVPRRAQVLVHFLRVNPGLTLTRSSSYNTTHTTQAERWAHELRLRRWPLLYLTIGLTPFMLS